MTMILALAPNGYTNPNVYTAKEDGTPTDIFAMGEKVRITAYSSNPCPYEIIIIDSEGEVRFTDTSDLPNYDRVWSGITDKNGWWEVKAGEASTHYATGFYHVVPESPFGTLSIVITCFAALGMILFRKRI